MKRKFHYMIWAVFCHLWIVTGSIAGENRILVPDFISSPPPRHFAGISLPMETLAEARKSALSDVARQILHEIGGQYDHIFISRSFGNPHDPKKFVDDQLRIKSTGLIRDLEQYIVRHNWSQDVSGKYTCFMLARYPTNMIREMRRLSNGARVLATVLEPKSGRVNFKLTETNGVSVVMSSATIRVQKEYRFAKTISFYIWPVPEGSKNTKSISFTPIQICSNSVTIQLKMDSIKKDLTDYFLGAKVKHTVMFVGIDEIGRPVQTSTVF